MEYIRYLELDFYRTSYKSVKVHQYDKNTRFLNIICVNNAEPFPLDKFTTKCVLKLVTPDNRHLWKNQTIQDDGSVLVTLEESMLLSAGTAKAELNVYNLSEEKLLSTMPFDLIIIGSVYDNKIIESTDEFDALNDILFKSEGIFETLNDHLDDKNAHGYNTMIRTEVERAKTAENELARQLDLKAPSANPILTGLPKAPTPSAENNSSQIATTAFVHDAVSSAKSEFNSNLASHISNVSNPHNLNKTQIELGNVDNTSDIDKPVSTAQQKAIDIAYANSNAYTDKVVADLINGAPSTLDTLGELSDAMNENKEIIESLNESIGKKANENEFNAHVTDSIIHTTETEHQNLNAAYLHSLTPHAPRDSQPNVIESIKLNGVTLVPTLKTVDINLPTLETDSSLTLEGIPADAGAVGNKFLYYLPLAGGKVEGALQVGDKVHIWSDTEGGNIRLDAHSSGYYCEMDMCAGNGLRAYIGNADTEVLGSLVFDAAGLGIDGRMNASAFYTTTGKAYIFEADSHGELKLVTVDNQTWTISPWGSTNTLFIHNSETGKSVTIKKDGSIKADGSVTGSAFNGTTYWADVANKPTVNGKSLDSNITLSASDVGSLSTMGGTITGSLAVVNGVTSFSDLKILGIGSGAASVILRYDNGFKTLLYNSEIDTIQSKLHFTTDGTVRLNETELILSNGSVKSDHNHGYLNLQANAQIQCRNFDDTAFVPIAASGYPNQSSRKYKTKIEDIPEELARKLLDYRVVTYDYIEESSGKNCMGLIAEEVADICEWPVFRNAAGEPDGLDYSRFVPQLIRMVQLQQEEINILKSRLAEVKTAE